MTDKIYTALDEPITEKLYEGLRTEWQKPINGRITVADGYTGSTVILDTTNELQHVDAKSQYTPADLVKLPVSDKPHLHRWVWCKSSS